MASQAQGPLPRTLNGDVYLMVVVDPFTKWLHALPIGDKRSETVAHAFVTSFIARYGIPVKVVSDNGCEFTGQAFQALIKQDGMTHLTTTPYHPAGNGQVERQNRTLADMLAHYVATGGTDWNEFVPLVCYAFNTSTHPNTGYTPFELLYGRPPRSPIETEVAAKLPSIYVDYPTYSQRLAKYTTEAWEITANMLEKVQNKMKVNADLRLGAKPTPFEIGSLVLKKAEFYSQSDRHKFNKKFIGPYIVVGLQPPHVLIRDTKGSNNQIQHIHAEKLKKYFDNNILEKQKARRSDLSIRREARELFSGEQENETESVPEVPETVNQPNLPGNQPNLQQEPKRTNKYQQNPNLEIEDPEPTQEKRTIIPRQRGRPKKIMKKFWKESQKLWKR